MTTPPPSAVDAVIVPTARGADHLFPAARLARELGAVLLALCSGESHASAVRAVLDPVDGLSWRAADVPVDHVHPLLPPPHAFGDAAVSVSGKRNLGLLVAHMVGWKTILFLDDDIVGIEAEDVRRAARLLGNSAAVAMPVEDFPSESVVRHAARLSGRDRAVPVTGSALLVDIEAAELGHFPAIYRGDELFLFDAMAIRRVHRAAAARQLRYDPFGKEGRARTQEFGDIVADGLRDHLDGGGRGAPTSERYWRDILTRRLGFLDQTMQRLLDSFPSPMREAARHSLLEARECCSAIAPRDITRFVARWRADRDAWRNRLATITVSGAVDSALRRVGIGLSGFDATVVIPAPRRGAPTRHRAPAEAFVAAGLRRVLPAPRGIPARPGEPFIASPSQHLADLAALMDRHVRPGNRVLLIGHWYGAWLSAILAAGDTRVAGLVMLMPTRSFVWPEDFRNGRDTWRDRSEGVYSYPAAPGPTLTAVRLPHAVVADACRYDLIAALRRLRIPTLFVAGSADEVVSPACVARLHDECGSPSRQMVELPVAHDFGDSGAQTELVNSSILAWLDGQSITGSASRIGARGNHESRG